MKCDWCRDPDSEAVPFPSLSPIGNMCPKCNEGTRRNDRALRQRYIAEGLIRPRGVVRAAA